MPEKTKYDHDAFVKHVLEVVKQRRINKGWWKK